MDADVVADSADTDKNRRVATDITMIWGESYSELDKLDGQSNHLKSVPAGVRSYGAQFKAYFKCALSSKCTCTFNLSDYSAAMRLALKQCANINKLCSRAQHA